jgi:hypothetical protein
MPATGACNVFPKSYKSLRITNAPSHRCQIALFDRKYCDGGNPADGADTVLFIPLASLYEGESTVAGKAFCDRHRSFADSE